MYIYVDLLPVSGINDVLNGSERGKNPSVGGRKCQFLNTDCRVQKILTYSDAGLMTLQVRDEWRTALIISILKRE
jgi:hypothetical protein